MKKLIKAYKNNDGELYLDSIMSIFVLFLCLAVALAVLPVIIQKQQLDRLAKETARYIEVTGETSGIDSNVLDMGNRIGIIPDEISSGRVVNIDTSYHRNNEIQLRVEFTVTIKKEANIGYTQGIRIPVQLESSATGRSEVFWK